VPDRGNVSLHPANRPSHVATTVSETVTFVSRRGGPSSLDSSRYSESAALRARKIAARSSITESQATR
jgi:hypothetical protein